MAVNFSRPLWKHQQDFLNRFELSPNFFLSWEMGTGKTTATIGWIRSKYQAGMDIFPTLILSPLATLWNWENEFKINSPPNVHEKVGVAYGKNKLKVFTTSTIVIANYEALDSPKFVTELKNFKPIMVICDEAHRIKNPKSKRFKTLLQISDSATYRGALTGTPILNSYLDLWAQFRFLDKGLTLGNNFFVFRSRYFRDKNVGMPRATYFPNWVPHPTTAKELTVKISQKTSRVKKDECLDLPDLIQKTEYVELSPEQHKAYKQMEDTLIAEVASGECAATNALVRVLRMLQIVSGHIQVENDAIKVAHEFKDPPRITRLMELVQTLVPDHKIIIWCTFIQNYVQISRELKKLNIEFAELTGQTKNKAENIERFQTDPQCRVIIANPQAGGVGVNLTAASYAIYFSRNYSLGDRLQSEARNHRGGSEVHQKITHIDLVTKDTVDEEVLRALLRKENFADNVLDRIKSFK